VIDEPGRVSCIRSIDTDVAVEGVRVLSPYIVSEEPSGGYKESGFMGVEINFSLPIEVY
jgi:hypothetical protein